MSCEPNTTTTTTTTTPAAVAAGNEAAGGLWLDAARRELLLAALTVAADRSGAGLDCPACAQSTCTEARHRERAEAIAGWRALALQLATGRGGGPPVAVVYRPDAARRWLADGAADEFGIDESFNTVELSIAAGLEDLLRALADDAAPQVWATGEPLQQVLLWRTADGDGIDGGAMITADLRVGDHPIRLATFHQGFDDFLTHEATSGIDAAVEALGRIANLVNDAVARLWAATAVSLSERYTVVGGWSQDEPIPVGVIAGEHEVYDGDETAFGQGLWATSVAAPDSLTAQRLAVAEMRQELDL